MTERANILIVDDRPDKHVVYRAILGDLQQNLIHVASGDQALKNLLKRDFAVILLDVNMPGLDGLETAALIRRRKRSAHVPIIFITADYGDEERMRQAYALGAVDFIVSPIAPEILRSKVKVFVELFLLAQQARLQAEQQLALAEERAARAAVERAAERILAGEGSLQSDNPESAIRPSSASGRPELVEGRSPQSALSSVGVGDRVIVGGLGLEAVVTSVHDGTADLDVRGKRMRASIRDLRVISSAGSQPPARVSVNVELQPRETTPSDLNVIGCTVDEAITRAERFLDESLLTDQRVIRLIHGYGTGQLKRALTGFLQQHPLVARFATAPPEQGGGGVTVVELKE